jgi:Rieske Fe-S protein
MAVQVPPDGRPLEAQPKWRRDFPIVVTRDEYVARRDFAKFLILTSGAFAAGQLWLGVQSLRGRRRAVPPGPVQVARLDDVPVGGALVFDYPGKDDPCLLLRPRADHLLAYGQKCTHLSCAVLPRLDLGKLHCPCHNGWFDLETGRPIAGPPRRPLPRVRLDVRDGLVLATGLELST